MFQRLKGAIDSRIAEEQARQKAAAATTPLSRTSSTRRSTSSRTESPASKPRKPRPKEDASIIRGPDPSEFENAFVIEDEVEDKLVGESSSAAEEKTAMMGDNATESRPGSEKEAEDAASPPKPVELPPEVRTKLRKLEKLESKYQELLRSYRIAHARAISIEPFEKQLKEHTPLSTISDPDALVEYLNQLKLKGDMVMDEFKRVSKDRDEYKKKFEEAEKQSTAAKEELVILRTSTDGIGKDKADTMSMDDTPTASVKSPPASVFRMFSPKEKAEPTDNKDVSEEFFSYDDEIPQLQNEVKEKTAEVEDLKAKIETLEKDLATAQESSSGLVADLEKATRELNESKEAATEDQSRQEKIDAQIEEIRILKEKVGAAEGRISLLEADLEKQKNDAKEKIDSLKADLKRHDAEAENSFKALNEEKLDGQKLREKLASQIKDLEESRVSDERKIGELQEEIKTLNKQIEEASTHDTEEILAKSTPSLEVPASGTVPGAAKKKNKKKKKGGNAAAATAALKDDASDKQSDHVSAASITDGLQAEISKLKEDIADRDSQISKLQSKRKTEEELREKIEEMEENLLMIGNEHVEARDQIKELQGQKIELESRIKDLEKEIETYKASSKNSEKVEADFKILNAEYEDLKSKTATLQTDLGAAQQLATSRYKDLTDLRDVLQKAQPELKSLRTENASLKSAKEELTTRTSELRRLEAREKDLKSDIASFKKQAADSQSEIRTLTEKITQETNARLRAEDAQRIAQRDMRKSEAEKIQFAASGEKSATELAKVQEEAGKLRIRVRELEAEIEKLSIESKGLRDEVELRGSQYNTAQGLLGSMRDQAGEMAMQLKEAQSQTESLEEELAEVQRLLSERTREGETMRRLLADVDDRADAKVREMRERMEAAIEERDRAEDEASTNGRRRAREVDELKNRIRDMERDLKLAVREKEELEYEEKEWRRKRDELESTASNSSKEVSDIRAAMNELRDALDGSEKAVREGEKQRIDLRRLLDEAGARYEKLQKELKAAKMKFSEGSSSRSSLESGRGINGKGAAAGAGGMDYVYLKTILLQFLEQKDRRIQESLVKTVLGQLLHFDKKDQEKWIAAISAK